MSGLKWLAGALCAGLLVAEIFLVKGHHGALWFQNIKGYSLVLGLLGSILLMFGAKALGKYFLYREEPRDD